MIINIHLRKISTLHIFAAVGTLTKKRKTAYYSNLCAYLILFYKVNNFTSKLKINLFSEISLNNSCVSCSLNYLQQ